MDDTVSSVGPHTRAGGTTTETVKRFSLLTTRQWHDIHVSRSKTIGALHYRLNPSIAQNQREPVDAFMMSLYAMHSPCPTARCYLTGNLHGDALNSLREIVRSRRVVWKSYVTIICGKVRPAISTILAANSWLRSLKLNQ